MPVFAWPVLLLYRRQSESARNRILQVLAVVILSSEVSVRIWQIIIGHYTLRNTLPLHLCSISIFLEAAAIFCLRSNLLKEFSYALSMPAALSALQVFELWLGHPGYIFLEAGVILVLWIILYLPWVIIDRKKSVITRHCKKKERCVSINAIII